MKVLVDAYLKDNDGKGDIKKFYLNFNTQVTPEENEQFIVEVPGIGERMLLVNRRIFDYTCDELILCCYEAEMYTPWRNR